jgi:hypothetical protein
MNPIPKIRAIIPNINRKIPKAASFSPILDIPVNIKPIPNIRTKNPERTATETNPKRVKAITIKPRIIKINAIPIFSIIFTPPFFYQQTLDIEIYNYLKVLKEMEPPDDIKK